MDIRFLSVDDCLQIHADTIKKDGGEAGLRDLGMLEAAIAMPRQQFGGKYLHKGIAAMAAAYMYHLCSNHAFIDGNKRVATLTMLVFLSANNISSLPNPKLLEKATMQLASGKMSKLELTLWLEKIIDDN